MADETLRQVVQPAYLMLQMQYDSHLGETRYIVIESGELTGSYGLPELRADAQQKGNMQWALFTDDCECIAFSERLQRPLHTSDRPNLSDLRANLETLYLNHVGNPDHHHLYIRQMIVGVRASD